jgi:hypothetical protein
VSLSAVTVRRTVTPANTLNPVPILLSRLLNRENAGFTVTRTGPSQSIEANCGERHHVASAASGSSWLKPALIGFCFLAISTVYSRRGATDWRALCRQRPNIWHTTARIPPVKKIAPSAAPTVPTRSSQSLLFVYAEGDVASLRYRERIQNVARAAVFRFFITDDRHHSRRFRGGGGCDFGLKRLLFKRARIDNTRLHLCGASLGNLVTKA